MLAIASSASLGAAVRDVSVPPAAGNVLTAYDRLHAAGLRVSIAGPFTAAASVGRTEPVAGTRVPIGTVVMLYLTKPTRGVAAASHRSVRPPNFLTHRVSAAFGWALARGLKFTAHLGALHGGNAPELLANFVIGAQRPAPGRPGTALIVWGHQPPPRPSPSPPVPAPVTSAPAPAPPPAPAPTPPAAATSDTPPTPTSTDPIYYQNPVYAAAAFPDPFVLDNGGTHSDYWAFGTGARFPLLHSPDLVHWTAKGTAMTTTPTWVSTGDWHPWSPSVLQIGQPCPGATTGGCYVMYYVGLNASLNRNCVAVATSPTPEGPYTDQGPLALHRAPTGSSPIGCGDSSGAGNIDPSPFVDSSSGNAYLYVSTDYACSGGTSCTLKPTISVIPLTSDFLEASGARVALLSGATATWEADNVSAPTVEGPSTELLDGTYYLFYSGGSYMHAYGMGYATSSSPTGPFTKATANPFFASTADAFSVGGGDRLVTGPHGGLWMVYAARTSASAGRTVWIDPFSWKPSTTPGAPDLPVISGPTTTPQSVQP